MGDVLEKARTLWNERVGRGENPLICSFEGFYQHYGECSNDAMQMLMCFCDHLKEVVQPLLLFSDDADFKRLIAKHVFIKVAKRKTLTYLKALQNRFARHYLNMAAICDVSGGFVGPYRAKGRNAVMSALSVVHDPAKVTEQNYIERSLYGLQWNESEIFFQLLIQMFSLTKIIEPLTTIDAHPYVTKTLWAPNTIGYRMRVKDMSRGSGHVLCYYTCGGHEYIYENNYGPFPFMWSEFMKYIYEQMELGHKIDLFHNRLWFMNVDTNENKSIGYYPMFSVEPDIKYEGKTFYTFMPGSTDPLKLIYSAEFNSFRTSHDNIEIAVNAKEYKESSLTYNIQPITIAESDTTIKTIQPPRFMRLGHNIGTIHKILQRKSEKQPRNDGGQDGGRRQRKTRRKYRR